MKKIDYRDFVVDWCTSATLDDLMNTTKLAKSTIKYREKVLRKAGVNLPRLRASTNGLDRLEVAQLNSLINKHARKA